MRKALQIGKKNCDDEEKTNPKEKSDKRSGHGMDRKKRTGKACKGYRWSLGLLGLMISIGLSGCTTRVEELSGKDVESKVIRITWWGGEGRETVTNQVLEEYQKLHPEIIFETEGIDWNNYFEVLSAETVKGQMPDLVQMDYQYIKTYSENGSLTDLQPFVDAGILETGDMNEEVLNSGRVDGRLTGIATGSTVFSVVCNPEVFEQAGVELPEDDWTWKDFAQICETIAQRTGKYGAAMTPVLDVNVFHYWVRQYGEELFSEDGRSLGYKEDQIYIEYVELFKKLMEIGAVSDPDAWTGIEALSQKEQPILTGDCGMMVEWNNFCVKTGESANGLELRTLPQREGGEKGLWLKPSMFFGIAETSKEKEACAEFLNWFLNSSECNEILKAERGVPISASVREKMAESSEMPENIREMFTYQEQAEAVCGLTPPPEPVGIDEVNTALKETANAYFYGVISAKEAAAQFRERVQEILAG